jgi:hypothetical protein
MKQRVMQELCVGIERVQHHESTTWRNEDVSKAPLSRSYQEQP